MISRHTFSVKNDSHLAKDSMIDHLIGEVVYSTSTISVTYHATSITFKLMTNLNPDFECI